jgi:hypothetical protein
LLSNTDVTLLDEDASVVDGLSHAGTEDLGLQSAFHKLGGTHLEDEVEFTLVFSEETERYEAVDKCLTFEQATRVLRVEGHEATGCLTDLCQCQLHTPDFTLATKSIFTAKLELSIQTLLLVRTTRSLVGLGVAAVGRDLRHLD